MVYYNSIRLSSSSGMARYFSFINRANILATKSPSCVASADKLPLFFSSSSSSFTSTAKTSTNLIKNQQAQDEKDGSKNVRTRMKKKKKLMCQVNNHPQYRLQVAKKKYQQKEQQKKSNEDITKILENTVHSFDNTNIKSDGVSSGSIASLRLRRKRIEILEKMLDDSKTKKDPREKEQVLGIDIDKKEKSTINENLNQTIEDGSFNIQIRKIQSDKTSSGAVASSRLQQKRLEMLEKMKNQQK